MQAQYNFKKYPRQMYNPKQQELRDAGWYTRDVDKLASGIYFYKIPIPELTNFEGWAVLVCG